MVRVGQKPFYDRGFPKLVVFFAEIEPLKNADKELWVIVGDMPPLYLDTVDHENGAEALLGYWLVFQWMVELYNQGLTLEGCPPLLVRLSLEPLELNDELAKYLGIRLPYIRRTMLDLFGDEISSERKVVDETRIKECIAVDLLRES